MADETPASKRKPLRLLPPKGGQERLAARPATPQGAGFLTVLLSAISVFALFVSALQRAMLLSAVAIGVIGWAYSSEAQAAINQRRWSARLNLPLLAIGVIAGVGTMSALNLAALDANEAAKQVVRNSPPAAAASAHGPSVSGSRNSAWNGSAIPDSEPALFDPITIQELSNTDLSLHVTDFTQTLISTQDNMELRIRELAADGSSGKISEAIVQAQVVQVEREFGIYYNNNLKPIEDRLRTELERRRTMLTNRDDPESCRSLDTPHLSKDLGPRTLSQHALCLVDLANLLDQESP